VARHRRQLADAHRIIREQDDYVAELRRDLENVNVYVSRLEARLRALDGDRLAAEKADLRAEVARLRARSPAVSMEEFLRLKETNARLDARLRAIQDGHVSI
jgi:hypothetical protein